MITKLIQRRYFIEDFPNLVVLQPIMSCVTEFHPIILKEGDIVNVDVTALKEGWHGDTSRMFEIGEISVKARKLINTTHEAMMKAIEVVKDGIHLGDIGSTIQKHVEAQGFSVVQDFCGHGIGKKFHKAPNVFIG